jgi:tritrans,polycis-undecaprenyl-diphosphate synthase [geranylgeranyl-diphosphate specific]
MEWCQEYGIRELTLYCFSIENFHSRPKDEFDYLMEIFLKEFEALKKDDRLEKNKIRINFIGRLHLFSEKIQKTMQEIMDRTKENDQYIVNFAMAYGGRSEIIDAAKKIAEDVKEGKLNIQDINEKLFSDNLYLSSEPDLVVRSGGEKRSSNFLPFQSVYSEWIYLEKMWPELEKADFVHCLDEYKTRKRRFGA